MRCPAALSPASPRVSSENLPEPTAHLIPIQMICAAPVRSFPGSAVLCFRSQGASGVAAIIHPAVSHRRHAALFPRSRRCQQTSPPLSAHSPAVGLRTHPCRRSSRNISPFPQSSRQASAWSFPQSGNPLGHSRCSVPALPLPEERTVGTDLLLRIIQSMTLPGRGAVCCPGGHLLGDDRERARRGREGQGRSVPGDGRSRLETAERVWQGGAVMSGHAPGSAGASG